jgi:hypothetical protein
MKTKISHGKHTGLQSKNLFPRRFAAALFSIHCSLFILSCEQAPDAENIPPPKPPTEWVLIEPSPFTTVQVVDFIRSGV